MAIVKIFILYYTAIFVLLKWNGYLPLQLSLWSTVFKGNFF